MDHPILTGVNRNAREITNVEDVTKEDNAYRGN